jgi:hypothetical protein
MEVVYEPPAPTGFVFYTVCAFPGERKKLFIRKNIMGRKNLYK